MNSPQKGEEKNKEPRQITEIFAMIQDELQLVVKNRKKYLKSCGGIEYL